MGSCEHLEAQRSIVVSSLLCLSGSLFTLHGSATLEGKCLWFDKEVPTCMMFLIGWWCLLGYSVGKDSADLSGISGKECCD